MSAHLSPRPLTPGQQAMIDSLVEELPSRRQSEADMRFLAMLTTPKPPLPSLDLSNARECLYASITGLGYVAGLAGSRNCLPFFGDGLKHWQNGWRQGRDHRARSMEVPVAYTSLTVPTLQAVMARMEQPPTGNL